MKLRILTAAALAALAALLNGCSTVRISREGVTMVEAEISGWYLLSFIPLGSGDPESPNGSGCKLFRDTTTVQNSLSLVDWALKREHADFADDLNTYTTDEYIFIALFRRHSIHTSAKLVKMAPIRETFADDATSARKNRRFETCR
ncbi:MAG: hypothetical protein E7049_06740 [Lentisphaerae bacterium]|jgi:hypothetical protein|nr:hypothetical protein [Lentisphaerota bacterium]